MGTWTPVFVVPFLVPKADCNALKVRTSGCVCSEHRKLREPALLISECTRDRLNSEAKEKHGVGLAWEFAQLDWDQLN